MRQVLLVKRRRSRAMGLPGGAVESGETLVALAREVREETCPTSSWAGGESARQHRRDAAGRQMPLPIVDFTASARGANVAVRTDAAGVAWVASDLEHIAHADGVAVIRALAIGPPRHMRDGRRDATPSVS